MSPDITAALASALIFAAIFVPLERLLPSTRAPWLRRGLGDDALFLFGNFLVWTPLVALALHALVERLAALPLAPLRAAFAAQPWWAQVLEALLLSDAATYWFHRLSHRADWLWRFHKVHHTAETVDWVAAYREHPLDNLLTRAVENLPLVLLGFPMGTIAGFIMFRGLWALFIHANVSLSPGPLRFVLGSPRLHHWHHEVERGASCNFANLDPLMDLLFGTYHDPGHDAERYGIAGEPRRGYLALIAVPLVPVSIARWWERRRITRIPSRLAPAAAARP